MVKTKNAGSARFAASHVGSKSGQRTYSSSSLHGQVVHELGRRIVSGIIGEGEVLPVETELGIELDVSRTALREGIKVLTAKGLLSSRTRTGTRVRPRNEWNMLDPDVLAWRLEMCKDEKFIYDLNDFRLAIEPVAASLSSSRATDEEIAKMKQAIDDMELAGNNLQAFSESDLYFHQIILTSCKNELMGSLCSLIETAVKFTLGKENFILDAQTVRMHRAVYDAIRNHDAKKAHAAMVQLLDYAHGQSNK